MKILSVEESKNLHLRGKGRFTLLHVMIGKLQPGEILEIAYSEWVTKKPPYKVIRTAAKKFNYQIEYGHADHGEGWWAKRIS